MRAEGGLKPGDECLLSGSRFNLRHHQCSEIEHRARDRGRGRDLEKVLRFHLDSLEGASVSWNFRVDGPGESRLDGLDGQWMRRVIAIENEARLEGGEPEAFEQIDESPCATRCRD